MKHRGWLVLLLISMFLGGVLSAVQADGFAWAVNCQTVDANGRLHVWVGYTSSTDLPDSYLAYIGNGPGIYMDAPLAGEHANQIEVLLPEDDSEVTLFLYPEDVSIGIDHSLDAPECGDTPLPSSITFDDAGVVNNPEVNERANTCYEPGQSCTTDAEWEAGWYLIREQYGIGP